MDYVSHAPSFIGPFVVFTYINNRRQMVVEIWDVPARRCLKYARSKYIFDFIYHLIPLVNKNRV